MLCRTAAVRSLAAARAALARSDIPDPPFEGPEVPTKTFFFRFEPQKSIQQMWVQSSKEDFVANRTIVETTSFFGAKCVISSQNLWAGNGGNKFDQKYREPFRFSKMVRKWESDQPQNHAKVTP